MQGSIVAVGGRKGNVFLVELSYTLAQTKKNDKVQLTAVSIWLFDSRDLLYEILNGSQIKSIFVKDRYFSAR